jgi:peptidyl-prolyl cis-trans isomerase C
MSPILRRSLAAAAALALAGPALTLGAPALAQTVVKPENDPVAQRPEGVEPAALGEVDPATVVAEVEGEAVLLSDLQALLAELPPQYQQMPDEALYDALLQQLTTQALMAQAAEDSGVASETEVVRALDRARREVLADYWLRQALSQSVTEEAIRAEYDAQLGQAEPVEEVRARHILLETEEEAQAVRQQLEGGADFAELAREKSTGPSGPEGGDLGWFTQDRMVPPFAEAAFAAETGDIAGPVETQFGWHVLEVTDRREQPKPAFEQVQGQIAQSLAQQTASELMAGLREGAEIETPEGRPGLEALRSAE